ncbi:MAG: carbon-nitrogen hydrolase family protein [Alphaproteobacteria bacterium]|nr:carbon-nitrogen hydrolase family protein [Alphaproteobacteria bacterium]
MPAIKAACIQTCTGQNPEANLECLNALIDRAVEAGAKWVITPENCNFMVKNRQELVAKATTEEADICVNGFAAKAREHHIWLQAGSFSLQIQPDMCVNRSMLFAPDGTIFARYDKIHLFDVALPNGEHYKESDNHQHGTQSVLADLPFGRVGMSVCYDLRFAKLYRALAEAGAQFLTIPSAFTQVTGQAHWHVLNRARAIEAGCYVLAPAQSGTHENGRRTYGHSLIIDPWGQILADAGTEENTIIYAALDTEKIAEIRSRLPVLEHGRDACYNQPQMVLDSDAK